MNRQFKNLKRRQLQKICKKHGIRANMKNVEMIEALETLFKPNLNNDQTCIENDENNLNNQTISHEEENEKNNKQLNQENINLDSIETIEVEEKVENIGTETETETKTEIEIEIEIETVEENIQESKIKNQNKLFKNNKEEHFDKSNFTNETEKEEIKEEHEKEEKQEKQIDQKPQNNLINCNVSSDLFLFTNKTNQQILIKDTKREEPLNFEYKTISALETNEKKETIQNVLITEKEQTNKKKKGKRTAVNKRKVPGKGRAKGRERGIGKGRGRGRGRGRGGIMKKRIKKEQIASENKENIEIKKGLKSVKLKRQIY
ncbi:aspartic/glutamic acid-rich protein [Anaeramoeba flamelloides]|uniref:Aspartic/glutamic acid-rich protein n=1 Tax=Anaeramoeba flamelloides TaxID=1746091 RepID=A0ABQ8YUQ9_9EUKA|nr:aspartic/glutamic acid-rich protein [Anaeramoeba flamelloides]